MKLNLRLNYSKKSYLFLYLPLLTLFTLYYFLRWPILAGDTDLWYHLNGGRYILENMTIPTSSFFSFISPPREWIDYFWLFQVLVYKVHSLFAYQGLIILRAAIFTATATFALCYFLNKRGKDAPLLYPLIISLIYFLLLLPRYHAVRPHTFTYLFIIIFLYILDQKPGKAIYLPLLSLIWVNLHGIEYPVMLLIIISYMVEFFVAHLRSGRGLNKGEIFFILPLILSIATVFLTPHGLKLIAVPYTDTGDATMYIQELRLLKLTDLLFLHTSALKMNSLTLFNLILLAAGYSVIANLIKREVRISHILMLAGGVFLLTKGYRFIYEFALLAMPALKASPLSRQNRSGTRIPKPAIIIFGLILMIMPFMTVRSQFHNPPKYPFSTKGLPQGVAAFLNHIKAGGSLLNHPNTGGYLQWMLYPRYKIFMDMEVPLLFTDEDMLTASSIYHDGAILRKFLEKYEPTFITVVIKIKNFKELIGAYPDYVMVFFDDSEVLYMNRGHLPETATEYELKETDPFTLVGTNITKLSREERAALMGELEGILKIYPGCSLANQVMAIINNVEGNYADAIRYTDAVIRERPESPRGYMLKGDAMKELGRYQEALKLYDMSLKRTAEEKKRGIYISKGFIYRELNMHKEAYRAFRKGIMLYSPESTYKDLYYLGAEALLAGELDKAVTAIRYAYRKVPEDNAEWHERIKKQAELMGIEEN